MNASTLRIAALLTCVAATSAAQQPPLVTETLDEVTVAAPEERERKRDPPVDMRDVNDVRVVLDKTLRVRLSVGREQTQVVFRHNSAARLLPEINEDFFLVNRPLRLELLPDRLIALKKPWIRTAAYQLAANIDEADGVPAHIPFGPGVALVNLDHVSLRDSQRKTGIAVTNAMHPQTRRCEPVLAFADLWSEGTNPYILLGNSLFNCSRAAARREGDLLFAESVPAGLRQALQELYDPVASHLANRLGSEPGNMFIAWWPESPRDGYRFQLSWNRNSLLLLNGSGWQRGIDTAQRESLRLSFMREQIQRRIRESESPAFTRSAVNYLLLLTRGKEDHTTPQRLSQELPTWMAGCADWLQRRQNAGNREADAYSLECGLVLQFVYDAVERSRSAGRQDSFSIWRKLLDASFRRGKSGATPAEFLASSADARRIAQGLVDGNMDWPQFAVALDGVGVRLKAVSGGVLPEFEVQSLEHFKD